MTKKEQIADNAIIEQYIDELNAEISVDGLLYCGRLRSCQANIYTTTHFIVLRSYNTIVAAVYHRTAEAALYSLIFYASYMAIPVPVHSTLQNSSKIITMVKALNIHGGIADENNELYSDSLLDNRGTCISYNQLRGSL